MKAATLDENQKNKSLSAKKKAKNENQQGQVPNATKKSKKKVKATTRAVLAEPKTSFDCEIKLSEAQCTEFEENMLKYHQHQPVTVPKWCDLKKYSKEERKEVRKLERVEIPSRVHVALGFNEVSRSLENKTAKIVISAFVIPEKIINNIRQTCDIYNIPFLYVNNFKEISKQCFGFSSMMMAFKDVPSDTKIYEFYKFLRTFIDENCKVDKPTIEFPIPMETEQSTTEKLIVEDNECETNNDIYVYRSNSSKRSFVPRPVRETKSFNADFISFEDVPTEDSSKASKVPYLSRNTKVEVLKKLRIRKLTANQTRKISK